MQWMGERESGPISGKGLHLVDILILEAGASSAIHVHSAILLTALHACHHSLKRTLTDPWASINPVSLIRKITETR
jgi:hypothetical protein